jgi:hypothetical protein
VFNLHINIVSGWIWDDDKMDWGVNLGDMDAISVSTQDIL